MKQLDSQWFLEYQKVGSFLPYSFLNGNKKKRLEQKNLFLKNAIRNPKLDYPYLDHDKYEVQKAKLVALRDSINSSEKNELVINAYIPKIAEKLNELEMLIAACNGNMSSFKTYSEAVYGSPKKEVFEFTIHMLKILIEKHISSENLVIKNASYELEQDLSDLLKDTQGEMTTISLPSAKTISAARTQTLKELGYLIQGIGFNKKLYGASDIKNIFDVALNRLGAGDWKTSIEVSSASAIDVDHEIKTVKIPSARVIQNDKILGIVLHEVGTHVARRINGEKSALMLLGLGLDRYERGDEGIATVREQIMEGEIEEFARSERHLAVSLCYGLDGIKRDFRDVYTIIQKYLFFKSILLGIPIEESREDSINLAWTTTERVFRGTDCETPGVCLTKDIIYQEGNIEVWEIIEKNPSEMLRFNTGKYDPTREEHRKILDALNIKN